MPSRNGAPAYRGSSPGSVLAQQLGGAHQRRGPLELLRGQQPQRVAHQHRDAVPAVDRLVALADDALQPADGERVGDQAEVGLGLAATGREEQQVGERAGSAALGVRRVGQRRDAQQHERELERPPRPVARHVDRGERVARGSARRSRAPPLDGDGVDALLPHRLVGEAERVERVGIGAHELDACARSRRRPCGRRPARPGPSPRDPPAGRRGRRCGAARSSSHAGSRPPAAAARPAARSGSSSASTFMSVTSPASCGTASGSRSLGRQTW